MTSLRSITIAAVVAALGSASAVGLSACSDDDVLGNDDDGSVRVSLTERDLKPGRVEVSDGKVEFEVHNDGDRLHAFAVETTNGVKSIKEIKPGESENMTVELAAGRYRMYDPRGGYRDRGVRGTVVVRSDRDRDSDTVTERTVERTIIDEEPDVVEPEADEPEVQEPEVQEPAPAQPAQPTPPPVVTQTVIAPPPPAQTTP
jgi:cupredoxin-like protein